MINRIRVKIEGLNTQKIINKLVDNEVLIENYHAGKKHIIFDVDEKDEYLVKKTCGVFHKHYQIISRNNILNLIKRIRYYFGFILAMIVSFCFIYVNNLYIYKIDLRVEGNGVCDLVEIKNILSKNGVYEGLQKKALDISKIEKIILGSSSVAGCTIKHQGGKINIILYPGNLKNETNQNNLYSGYNAVILDVDVYVGVSKIKKGDIVKAGDLLIENNNGAAGKILAKVYFSDYIIYNENQVISNKTGRVCKERNILLLNKNLNKSRKYNTFTNFIEEECVFCVSNNLFVPICVIEKKYYEIEYQDVVVKFDEVENNLKEQLYNSVQKNIPDIDSISNVTYSVVTENNLTRLDCFIECEIDLLA